MKVESVDSKSLCGISAILLFWAYLCAEVTVRLASPTPNRLLKCFRTAGEQIDANQPYRAACVLMHQVQNEIDDHRY